MTKVYKYYGAGCHKGQSFKQPSSTVQGQAMSIVEIMKRAQQGLPIPQQNLPYGDDEDFVPVDPNADISDIYNMANQAQAILSDSESTSQSDEGKSEDKSESATERSGGAESDNPNENRKQDSE